MPKHNNQTDGIDPQAADADRPDSDASETRRSIGDSPDTQTPDVDPNGLTLALTKVWGVALTGLTSAWGWMRRMALGASKELVEDGLVPDGAERTESPSGMAVRAFFSNRLALGALLVLLSLFLFVFVGSALWPIDLSYTDSLQANIAPNYAMLRVPRALRRSVRSISGFANFSVGVSEENTLYMWGYTEDALQKTDLARFPSAIREGGVYTAAAGYDHVLAVTTEGEVVAWGDSSRAQYGDSATGEGLVRMPAWLKEGLDPLQIDQLTCGYQVSALVYGGRLYLWGNGSAMINLSAMQREADRRYEQEGVGVRKVALGNYYGMILYEDGRVSAPTAISDKTTVLSDRRGRIRLSEVNRVGAITDIAATNNCFLMLTKEGEMLLQGAAEYGESAFAAIPEGERVVALSAGTRHFAVVTDAGRAYAWGHDDYRQTAVNGKEAAAVFAGAKQTYLVDREGRLCGRVGMRGYLFGTDSLGRDTFRRLVHGGKMTMTVGAVAVLVSTVIAIVVGCLSGYFGGWVDIVLMRLTEIFSAIPFLPFAMMLSYVLQKNPIDEKTRILIVMVILGLLSWTGLARIIRAQVLAEREKEFVLSARSMGIRQRRIAFRHVLPNVASVILVSVTLDFAGCLLTESSLSYLGFGVQQPRPTWGNMLNGANNSIVIQSYRWQWIFPSLFLAIATVSINIIGDALRDILDPKSGRDGEGRGKYGTS